MAKFKVYVHKISIPSVDLILTLSAALVGGKITTRETGIYKINLWTLFFIAVTVISAVVVP